MIREAFHSFDYESLNYQDRKDIHDALAETTLKHISGSDGLFTPVPFDVAANPSQRVEHTRLSPAPTTFEEIDILSSVASPRLYPAIKEALDKQKSFVSIAEQRRKEGKHLFSLTTHQQMVDIALYDAAWVGATKHDKWEKDNGLIISRGVTTVQAFGMAASEVTQKLGNVFLSFPRTKTIMNLSDSFKKTQEEKRAQNLASPTIDIDQLITTNNHRMRNEIKEWLEVSPHQLARRLGRHALGRYLHVAFTGSTDKVTYSDNHAPERIIMGKVANGTADIVKHGLVVPIVLWDQDDPIVEIGAVMEVSDRRGLEKVQEWQRSTLAKKLGIPDSAVTVEQ